VSERRECELCGDTDEITRLAWRVASYLDLTTNSRRLLCDECASTLGFREMRD
jgi:hypothetical protein